MLQQLLGFRFCTLLAYWRLSKTFQCYSYTYSDTHTQTCITNRHWHMLTEYPHVFFQSSNERLKTDASCLAYKRVCVIQHHWCMREYTWIQACVYMRSEQSCLSSKVFEIALDCTCKSQRMRLNKTPKHKFADAFFCSVETDTNHVDEEGTCERAHPLYGCTWVHTHTRMHASICADDAQRMSCHYLRACWHTLRSEPSVICYTYKKTDARFNAQRGSKIIFLFSRHVHTWIANACIVTSV